ncbi:MAG: corrinoid protein [Anaerolineae bacterium]|jgi:5-methyltetrahydrofolate--homocysteine methyltransferase|nr:corrinoid protein [Anaerolineae bacterium]
METLEIIRKAIIEGQAKEVEQHVQAALDSGMKATTILYDGLIPAMAEVGRLYEEGEYFVPEMLIAARAMKTGLGLLKPFLVEGNVQPLGKVAIATVQGDLHDIGKNLVSLMLEGAGFEIVDLGVNAEPQKFVDAVQQQQVNVVAMSALLTTTMTRMKDTITALDAAGVRGKVKVIIGGAPITQAYADEIGADGYAPDASQAVNLTKRLLAAS